MTPTNKLRSFERSEAVHGIKEQEPVAERAWFTISELNAWADKKLAENQIKGEEHMTPKFLQLLEQCITDGVILGHKRAYKHNDAPSESDINQSIVNEVLNEIHEWFDFDEAKLKEKNNG